MKNKIKAKDWGVYILVLLMVVVLGVWVSSPSKADRELERQQIIQVCLDNEYSNYMYNWNVQCEIEGDKNGCFLPMVHKVRIDTDYASAQDRCIERFK